MRIRTSILVSTAALLMLAAPHRVRAADDLEKGHEKSVDAAKDAAEAVQQGAEGAAEGAKQAIENPVDAAKQAGDAAAEKSKQVVLSFSHDMHHYPERLWRDLTAIPSWHSAIVLGLGAGLAEMSNELFDDDVRRGISRDPGRLGHVENSALDVAADPLLLFAYSSAVYGTSLLIESPRLHDFSMDMMSALTIELPVVFALKKTFHTRRPNGDPDGFPSGHVTGAVTHGTLLAEHFGLYPGIAGFAFAGVVAYHRLDYRKHDLSDVIFATALGYVVGRAVGEEDEELPLLHAHLVSQSARIQTASGERSIPGLGAEWRF